MVAALEANPEIVAKNYTIFGSLDSVRMINSERCECIRRDVEFAELCEEIECEIADEEEEHRRRSSPAGQPQCRGFGLPPTMTRLVPPTHG